MGRPGDPPNDRVGHLDHQAGIFGLHHLLVGGAAAAEVVAEVNRCGDALAQPGQHVEGFGAEIDYGLPSIRRFPLVSYRGLVG